LNGFVRNPEYARDIAARLTQRPPPQHFADAPIAEGSDTPNWVTTEPPRLHVAAPEVVAPALPTEADIWNNHQLSYQQKVAAIHSGAVRDPEPAPSPPSGPPSLQDEAAGLSYQQRVALAHDPSKLNELVLKNQAEAGQATDRFTLNRHEEEQKKAAAEAEASKSAPVSAPPSAEHAAASDALPRPSPGTYVPAHEVPRVSPERQAANEQTYAAEAAAEGGAAEAEAKEHEGAAQAMRDAIETQQADLEQSKGERAARAELTSRMLRDAEKAASDVASQKIDPNRFWKNTSTGDRIRYAIAAALGGFAGDHTATNMIQSMISQDIDAQKSDIENQRTGANAKMTHYNAALQAYGSMDAADEHDRAAKLMYAQMQVKALAEESQAPIVRERARALEAQLARKAVDAGIAFNPLIPGQMVGGGGEANLGGLSGAPIEVSGPAQTVKLPDGREAFLPRGGEEVAKAVQNSYLAADAAKRLSAMMDHEPSIVHPVDYKVWANQVAALVKQASVADAGHLGGRAGGALGQLRLYGSALDAQAAKGGENSAFETWRQMRTGRKESIKEAAHMFAENAPKDADRILTTHNALVGVTSTQEYPGVKGGPRTSKVVFLPRAKYSSSYDDGAAPAQSAVPQMHPIQKPTGGQ
jgi:hypothetical protein